MREVRPFRPGALPQHSTAISEARSWLVIMLLAVAMVAAGVAATVTA